jgi:hypothetical protein
MLDNSLVRLLVEIHRNVDRVCEDLQTDRPDLAASVRQHAAWIPRPEDLLRGDSSPSRRSVRRLTALLYDALDEGVIDARQFDVLMVERARAARVLDEQKRR